VLVVLPDGSDRRDPGLEDVMTRNQRLAGIDRVIAARADGLDQQGRHLTRPIPAEACTEVGADDYSAEPMAVAIFWSAYASIFLVAAVAALSLLL
jgi:hypothetical protein